MLASISEQHDFCCASGANGHAHENGLVIIIACLNTFDGLTSTQTILAIVFGITHRNCNMRLIYVVSCNLLLVSHHLAKKNS